MAGAAHPYSRVGVHLVFILSEAAGASPFRRPAWYPIARSGNCPRVALPTSVSPMLAGPLFSPACSLARLLPSLLLGWLWLWPARGYRPPGAARAGQNQTRADALYSPENISGLVR